MTSLRLDKWLWFARFAKTRSLAAKLCSAGVVTVGGTAVAKPGHLVRLGDTVTVEHGRIVRRVTVLALGDRRGPPAEARLLYAEPEPPRMRRDVDREAWIPLLDDGAGNAGPDRPS
ncbi:MAG TPA: RNA-binding S4 domain-containing protein [Bradyrhizobium sp.]|jgi:ribosome-associated heat shock protein Hsp15|nr:RNA-binding S4 domain-containing protein [Bradyrhizobium sp.]